MADTWLGVDLGSHVDYSAVSVLTRSLAIDSSGLPMRNSRHAALYDWRLRGLMRFPLRTAYTEVAKKVASIARSHPLGTHPRVCVDSTGVGIPCTEMIRTALKPYPDIEVWGCSITAGEGWRVAGRQQLNVSKIELTGAFREVLEGGRFKVCRHADGKPIRGADVLVRELRSSKCG